MEERLNQRKINCEAKERAGRAGTKGGTYERENETEQRRRNCKRGHSKGPKIRRSKWRYMHKCKIEKE
jgi:hypothetical protein